MNKYIFTLLLIICSSFTLASNYSSLLFYEDFDGVSSSNFTGGAVGAGYKYNTTNGYQAMNNSFSQPYAYPTYYYLNASAGNEFTFSQLAYIVNAGSNQYYGQQGIQFYSSTTGQNYTLFIIPYMTEAFPKTTWIVFNGTDGDNYASQIINITGCPGVSASTWVKEKLVVRRLSSTQYNISMFIINVTSDANICNISAIWSDSNMQNFNRVRWGSKDSHGSGSPGYIFDEVILSITTSNPFSNFICSSSGDAVSPYTTDDTTPTFRFNTSATIACRISDENWNYTTMGSSRDCDIGIITNTHTCTLTSQDGLVNYNTTAYISCSHIENSTAQIPLAMLIESLESSNSTEAIMQGIENSVVGTGATIYSNQKIYLRALNGSSLITTVDKVVVYGNKRWLINYVNASGTKLGLFNITPVVYVLDMKNMSIKGIRSNVTALINSTSG